MILRSAAFLDGSDKAAGNGNSNGRFSAFEFGF